MSENVPTSNDPHGSAGDEPQRPPVPAQPAADAAATTPAEGSAAPAPASTPAAAPQGYAASAPSAQQPYGGAHPYGANATTAPQHAATTPHHTATATAHGAATDQGSQGQPSGRIGAGKVVGIMVAAALVGGAAGLGGAAAGASLFPQSVVTTSPSTVIVNNTDSVNQTTAIAAKVVPSVVTISVSSGSSGGTGSGVVLTADGYVVTNTHVVTLDGQVADPELTVTTSDGKVYSAEIVGTDPTYDLAVIKLTDASGLTPIEFADSTKLNVGDQTVAVGAPLGLPNTVTAGIVSALNRSIQIASSAAPDSQGDSPQQGQGDSPFRFDFGQGQQQSATRSISIAVIQTDAAINPGNSGGALANGDGKLIGINVAIASTGGSSSSPAGSIGVGFSIPSVIVKRISDEIIENGKATHGLLGAIVGDAAAQPNVTMLGAYIIEVTSGGPADAAGLKKGDVVTSFNGFPVTDATDLIAQVRALAAGSTAPIVYVRDGKTISAEVTLGSLTQ